MPIRLRFLVLTLCALILGGSVFALYIGVQEVRLSRSGARRELLAEELSAATRGHLMVLGCARHDLEVAISSAGIPVAGERERSDRSYFVLTPQSDCAEDTPKAALKVVALVEAADGLRQGLARLYEQGYRPPPTRVILEGVIGYGAGDSYRYHRALRELRKQGAPANLDRVPLLVKDKRPGSKAAAYGTAIVGLHGILLVLFLFGLWLRARLRGGLPQPFPDEADED